MALYSIITFFCFIMHFAPLHSKFGFCWDTKLTVPWMHMSQALDYILKCELRGHWFMWEGILNSHYYLLLLLLTLYILSQKNTSGIKETGGFTNWRFLLFLLLFYLRGAAVHMEEITCALKFLYFIRHSADLHFIKYSSKFSCHIRDFWRL